MYKWIIHYKMNIAIHQEEMSALQNPLASKNKVGVKITIY